MLGEIDLGGADREKVSDGFGGLLLDEVQVENLVVLRIDLALHAIHGGVNDVLFPFLFPDGFELGTARIGEIVEKGALRSAGIGGEIANKAGIAFADLVDDPAMGHVHEPAFEGADRGVVFEFGHFPGDGDDSLLNNLFSFGIRTTALDGKAVDEFPISFEKGTPAFVVVRVAKPAEQTSPCGQETINHDFIARTHHNRYIAEKEAILSRIYLGGIQPCHGYFGWPG